MGDTYVLVRWFWGLYTLYYYYVCNVNNQNQTFFKPPVSCVCQLPRWRSGATFFCTGLMASAGCVVVGDRIAYRQGGVVAIKSLLPVCLSQTPDPVVRPRKKETRTRIATDFRVRLLDLGATVHRQ